MYRTELSVEHTHTCMCAHTQKKFAHSGLSPGGASDKEPTYQCRKHDRGVFSPWVGKIPWRKEWHTAPVFLPRKFHGQRSLLGYNPGGHKESDMTEQLSTHTEHAHTLIISVDTNKGKIWSNIVSQKKFQMVPEISPLTLLLSKTIIT